MEEMTFPVDIAPGITRTWSADRQLMVMTISNFKHPAIDAWVAAMKEVITHPDGSPYIIQHVTETPSAFVLPYLERKFQEVARLAVTPAFPYAYFAIVVPSPVISLVRIMTIMSARLLPRNQATTIEVFETFEAAAMWMDEKRKFHSLP